MARAHRPLVEGGLYHVYDLGNRHQVIFTDDTEREDFLLRAGVIAHERGWSVLAWCLMDNHVHLLLRTRDADLGDGMRELLGGYAAAFNRRHGFRGHLFHGRYGAKLVRDEAHLHAELRYIAQNPVKASMVDLPEDHPWSSSATVLHGLASPLLDRRALFDLLDPFDHERARHRYIELTGCTDPHNGVSPRGSAVGAPLRPSAGVAPEGDASTDAQEGDRPPSCGAVAALRSAARWDVLLAVGGGAVTQAALCAVLGLGQGSVSRHVRALVAGGLLDGRREEGVATYALSRRGAALLDAVRG